MLRKDQEGVEGGMIIVEWETQDLEVLLAQGGAMVLLPMNFLLSIPHPFLLSHHITASLYEGVRVQWQQYILRGPPIHSQFVFFLTLFYVFNLICSSTSIQSLLCFF